MCCCGLGCGNAIEVITLKIYDKYGFRVIPKITNDGKYYVYFPKTNEYSPAFETYKGLKRFLETKKCIIEED